MRRRSTGAQAGAEGAARQLDARRILGTASGVGRNKKQTGCGGGMGYCDGAEHKVVTNENSQGWQGAALCPSGDARCQGSALQERRTGRRIQYSNALVPGSWLMVLRTRPRRECWDGQVAAREYSSLVLRSHISVVPLRQECVRSPPIRYMAAKLSARQDGAALKTLDLRMLCSEGLTMIGLGGRRRHGRPPGCNEV